MHGLLSVARCTLRQCLRMKVAGVFIVLVGVLLAAMPFTFARQGDGTLAGQIRTFLSYGFALTGGLLCVMTLLVAAGVTSGDVEQKFVFTLAVKPLPRWQYLLGRWLGVVVLDAMLLAVSGLFIYVMAQRLRTTPPPAQASTRLVAEDRRAVETEVFAARGRVTGDWDLDFDRLVASVIEQDKRTGQYDRKFKEAIELLHSEQDAAEALARRYRENEATRLDSIGPGQMSRWIFRNVRVDRATRQAAGKVTGTYPEMMLVQLDAPPELLARLIYRGPVRVGELEAEVMRVGKSDLVAHVFAGNPAVVADLKPGSTVTLTADPTVQVQYELTPPPGAEQKDMTYPVFWVVRNPKDGRTITMQRNDPAKTMQTLTVSARYVAADGTVQVEFHNTSRGDIIIQRKDVGVLFPMGSFEMNLVKGVLLLQMRLMFVAALGVAAGGFLSFPVACLCGFVLMGVSLAFGFLVKSTELPAVVVNWEHVVRVVGHYVLLLVTPLAPNFAGTSPSDALVEGTYISWLVVTVTAGITLVGHTLLTLTAGWLLYQWRELARVQV